MTDSARSSTTDRIELAIQAAVRDQIIGAEHPVVGFIDVDALRATVATLQSADFGETSEVLHSFAAKACPLMPVLRLLAEQGMGCEVASPGELAQAMAAGFPPERIVLDSPVKSRAELSFALRCGVMVNADNLRELERIDALREGSSSVLGLRINPQVGSGTISAMSTASEDSKFGVPLADQGVRAQVLAAYAARPWLTQLHVHVGSQGCPLELVAEGIAVVYELAEEINAAAGYQQVSCVDIGGGLPVNFADDRVTPTFEDYAAVVRARVPGLFDGRYSLITEFGRSLLAKNGFIVTAVEYVKEAGGSKIVLTHAGAQIATRTVFMPAAWPLRVSAYDGKGMPKQWPDVVQTIAGPCCFAGDLIARDKSLPELAPGDLVVLHDTGAYYLSSPWSYNSLPRPAVYGFSLASGEARFAPIRAAQTIEEVVAEAGMEHLEGLSPLCRAIDEPVALASQ